ncbi:hypothetical protein ACIG47_03170 [Promicromonospora sp. NPDC052451]|uniref:DUF6414 family protein n=1 Tax=Promicromonospora sp. NPDC052451 TaxID=3364407 RepID=UPI0037C8BD98
MSPRRKSSEEETNTQVPALAIYQHAEHVAGVLQQLFDRPLVTEEVLETESSDSGEKESSTQLSASGEGGADLPVLAKVAIAAGVKHERGGKKTVNTGSRATQSFVYSQSYYLRLIRSELKAAGMIKPIKGIDDANSVDVGNFVEFSAAFEPNELTVLTDVITPSLVAAIARQVITNSATRKFSGYDSYEKVQMAAEAVRLESESGGALAAEVADAVISDFRSSKTREYYGQIGSGDSAVTAITICDSAHFAVEDEDRILDGTFTVLGKVVSGVEEDVPLLNRNKVLSRIAPEGVDWLADAMAGIAKSSKKAVGDEEFDPGHLNMTLRSRVSGKSFRVVPLAIFV